MDELVAHLKCPDCNGKLELRDELICTVCNRSFVHSNDFINLLPLILSNSNLSEEKFWASDSREGLEAHPLIGLLISKDPILNFYEQILPSLQLSGNILELGSGLSWLSSFIKLKFPNTNVISTDVSQTAIKKGIQESRFLNVKIDRFIVAKAEKLPFENNFFDFIFGSAVIHHTSPPETVNQIFRVLKRDGTYIGFGELATPKVLRKIWTSRLGLAGRREKELGVKEGSYSLQEWKDFFYDAGFREVDIILDRNPDYKSHWFIHLYYKIVRHLPENFVKKCLATSFIITAYKSGKK